VLLLTAVVASKATPVAGAEFARDTTLFHLAAEFAFVSFELTNKYDTSPWLSSWTNALMLAKYVALASFLLGPARTWVWLVSTFST